MDIRTKALWGKDPDSHHCFWGACDIYTLLRVLVRPSSSPQTFDEFNSSDPTMNRLIDRLARIGLKEADMADSSVQLSHHAGGTGRTRLGAYGRTRAARVGDTSESPQHHKTRSTGHDDGRRPPFRFSPMPPTTKNSPWRPWSWPRDVIWGSTAPADRLGADEPPTRDSTPTSDPITSASTCDRSDQLTPPPATTLQYTGARTSKGAARARGRGRRRTERSSSGRQRWA